MPPTLFSVEMTELNIQGRFVKRFLLQIATTELASGTCTTCIYYEYLCRFIHCHWVGSFKVSSRFSEIPYRHYVGQNLLIHKIIDFETKYIYALNIFFKSSKIFLYLIFFQLLRKRHVGNDIVTIVFQEPGALPFTPKTVRSHFQHVFIVVRCHNPNTEHVRYR